MNLTPSLRDQVRRVAAVALLAAVSIAWAAAPLSGGRGGTRLALIVAVLSAALSVGRLVAGDVPIEENAFDSFFVRTGKSVVDLLHLLPWAEVMIVAVLVLEALHRSRPWHTALLGLALLAYVFAVHLAQARTGPRALAPQLPVLAAGAGLLVLAIGAAALPRLHGGPASELLRVLAVLAAVAAAGLALPTTGRSSPDRDQ
jgi:hypothetical protein